jgi:hypothetical protein
LARRHAKPGPQRVTGTSDSALLVRAATGVYPEMVDFLLSESHDIDVNQVGRVLVPSTPAPACIATW